jgi:hypothetical protein
MYTFLVLRPLVNIVTTWFCSLFSIIRIQKYSETEVTTQRLVQET